MDFQIQQRCPQCGGTLTRPESHRLLQCPYCGVCHFSITASLPRYRLLPRLGGSAAYSYIPYLRLRGSLFQVHDTQVRARVIDTTGLGLRLHNLPPSLGLRPQALPLVPVVPTTRGHFLPLGRRPASLLEWLVQRERPFARKSDGPVLHQAYVGERISCLYLPVQPTATEVLDGITGQPLGDAHLLQPAQNKAGPPDPRWQSTFLPALCPHCGDNLTGAPEAIALICRTCQRGWQLRSTRLEPFIWRLVPGDHLTDIYLGFWRIMTAIPALSLVSFADFIEKIHPGRVVQPGWYRKRMCFWLPAFTLSPRHFLQAARQTTLAQDSLEPGLPRQGRLSAPVQPISLPSQEAMQAIRVLVASMAMNKRKIYPLLSRALPTITRVELVLLPFTQQGPDWYQPLTRTTIRK